MKLKKINADKFIILIVFAAMLAACSKMDSTYIDFIKKGSITYVGTPDSLKAHSGKNRLKITWTLSDPSTTMAKLYWNNKNDSLTVDIPPKTDTVSVWLKDLREGSYSFDMIMYDKDNNRSVASNLIGRVYGDNYINTLLARPVKTAIFINGKVDVTWGAADSTVIATELTYIDKNEESHTIIVPVDSEDTQLENYALAGHETFQYRTLYVPDSLSIDTFYSNVQTVKVTGPAIEYGRNGWTAGTEDYDIPSGRVPQNTLDNKTNTIWHMDKTHGYPHAVTIDMKAENLVNGFTYIQRTPLDGAAKLVEIQISSNNINWKSLGAYTFENLGTKQYLELLEPASFRYFRMIVKSDYKNGTTTAIAELGAYKR